MHLDKANTAKTIYFPKNQIKVLLLMSESKWLVN